LKDEGEILVAKVLKIRKRSMKVKLYVCLTSGLNEDEQSALQCNFIPKET
jgi:acyl-CoA hydrolase